jgi:branched-chain amino acid transport system substrate-binding protein
VRLRVGAPFVRSRHPRLHSWKGAVCLSAALCIFLVGCGSSKSSTSSGTSAPTTGGSSSPTTAGTTGDPIQVGTIMTASGLSGDPLFETIAHVWEEWTNAHGGVNGRPVHLTILDDAGNPATGLTDAKQLVQQDHVVAIIGSTSADAESWLTYTNGAQVPVIGGTSAFYPEAGAYAFPASLSVLNGTLAAVELAQKIGAKKVANFYCAESPQCSQGANYFKEVATTAGMGTYNAAVSSTAPDYTAPCLSAISAGVNLISPGTSDTVLVAIVKACTQNGYKGPFLAPGNGNPSWDADAALAKAQIYSTNYVWNWNDTTTPAQQAYYQAIHQYDPSMLTSPAYTGYLQVIWAGMQMFVAAAEAANLGANGSSADVVNGLYMLHNETLGGLIGPITYQRSDKNHVGDCYFVNELQNGKWIDPFGSQALCVTPTAA